MVIFDLPMIKRSIYISKPSLLSLEQSQLVIEQWEERFQVPIEDIAVLILDEPMITISHPLLAKLAEKSVIVITSDERHTPIGLHLPLYDHSMPSLYWRDQINVSKPTAKQIWQQLIQVKISWQADVLQYVWKDDTQLRQFATNVRSGDTDNIEAQAARIYWSTLFGGEFVRWRYEWRENSALNYWYALIRASLARAVVGAWLCPMIGIWHDNRYNAFNLVDDLIEPLRPMVDRHIVKIVQKYTSLDPLTSEIKKDLCTLLTSHLLWENKEYDLFVVLTYYCANFREALSGDKKFQIPTLILD